jgi:uncharacterized phage-associated protein
MISSPKIDRSQEKGRQMPVSVFSAAKRLAARSGWKLSHLEIQKILYLAHMVYLGKTKGAPLIKGHFEAWDFGPVHPELYHRAKIFGSSAVQNIFQSDPDLPDGLEQNILDEAASKLAGLGAGRLVNATHRSNGAWERNYRPGERGNIIPNEEIWKEYESLTHVQA